MLLFSRPGNGLARFFVRGAAAFSFTFVQALFAFGQSNLTFDLTVFKVHARWHQRVAFLLGLGLEFAQLVGTDKKLAGAERRVSGVTGIFIGSDVSIEQP